LSTWCTWPAFCRGARSLVQKHWNYWGLEHSPAAITEVCNSDLMQKLMRNQLHYNKMCLDFQWIHWLYWTRTNEKAGNSLVYWTGTNELHPHFVLVLPRYCMWIT
jgi:hypothetical protein